MENKSEMDCVVSVSLLDGAKLIDEGAAQVAIETPPSAYRQRLTLDKLSPGLRAALDQLADPTVVASVPYLVAKMLQSDGPSGIGQLMACLARLGQRALLSYTLRLGEQPLLEITPLSIYFRYQENKITADDQNEYALSRFACCRNRDGRWLLESPLAHAELSLHSPLAQLAAHRLAQPCSVAQLAQDVPDLGVDAAARLLDFLANAALLVNTAESANPETDQPVLGQWDFHDLLFHSRSRLGRHANPYGGTYPFKDKFTPPPVIKPAMSNQAIALYQPDPARLLENDMPFSQVLESRCSIREQGDPPINAEQLGEFLWRCARVKKLAAESGVSFRPYPGGGALHELEIYPLVSRCDGLEPALYHYDPSEHRLFRVSELTPQVKLLAQMYAVTATLEQPSQVVLIIAARFQRVQNKYQSMTYAVILKHVGVLYQTFYLVATAMGLAPCGLGGGHSDLFSQAAGLDYYEETSVGEFILGSRKH